MMLIGVDPHKSTHTATAVEPGTNTEVASIRIDATLREYRRMLTWAARWPQRRWAIENAEGLGRHLASWLLARGEHVVDVPSTATARVRQLSRGGVRKNDRIDAAAAACVAALQGDARPLAAEGISDALAVLDERRVNLAQARVRAVNQLHALLRALLAGGAPTDLSAANAAALLRTVRPSGEVERVRKAVAGDLVAEIRSLDTRLKASAKAIADVVEKSGSTLTQTVGIGPIIAGRLIGRTGRPSRFSTSAAYVCGAERSGRGTAEAQAQPAGATYSSAPAAPCLGQTAEATSAHVMWNSCATGMSMGFIRTEDGRPGVNLPMGGAGTGNTFLDALTDDTAVFGTALGDQAGLYLSTDRGTHFTRLSAIPAAFTNSGDGAHVKVPRPAH